MTEHEDDVMPSVEKSNMIVDSAIVTENLGGDEGKTDGFLDERDEGEDMMVDVVGADEVEIEYDHVHTVVNLETKSGSDELVEECLREETETHDMDIQEVAGSGEIRVLTVEKTEVILNDEGVSGDIAVLDSKESTERGLTKDVLMESVKEDEILETLKIAEPLITTDSFGIVSRDEAEDIVSVNPCLVVCANNQSSPTKVVNSVTDEGDIIENMNEQVEVEVETLSKYESFHQTVEVIPNDAQNGEPNERGLTKDEEIVDQPTDTVQEVKYVDGVIDDIIGKPDDVLDSSKIPEALTTVNLGQQEVKHPDFPFENADMETGVEVLDPLKIPESVNFGQQEVKHQEYSFEDDAGVDIDEVMGWKDEIPEINVTDCDPEPLQQKLPEPSNEQNLTREPIVYGRRAHVEVPLYDPTVEITPTSLEDQNLEIKTDSDEDYESVEEQEEEHNFTDQSVDENSFSLNQFNYFQPTKNEGEFSVSDLVWGKVRSHPWWPGQIIDPSDASQKAMKYHKKDSFLVAYFGDHTFAWNNSSVLKPFRANFSQIEKQTNLESFEIAVECALEEVSRRVELGLACSCVHDDSYKKIQYQVIENSGVRKKASRRNGLDESANVSSFEPDKLVDYVRLLAQFPFEGDKMDIVMAKAQLSSYNRFKGYRELPEFQVFGDILEDSPIEIEKIDKNGENFENKIENVYQNKEISLSDVTDDAPESVSVSSSGYRKRKAREPVSDIPVKRRNRPSDKVSTALVSSPKPSFKVGALIQRVASQLTGPPSKVDHVDQREVTVAEMLSQLHLTAQDPMKDYAFLNTIIPFFYDRRAAVFSKSLKKITTVEKPIVIPEIKASDENTPEEFEFEFSFDDANDSYWTDRIVQNHSEDQSHQNGSLEEYEIVAYEQQDSKPKKRGRKPYKKRVTSNNNDEKIIQVKEESEVDRKRRENSVTEVVLKYSEGINFPSEIKLNKMFRRFGPLMESETEVDREGGRARVVFKKCSDAEVAQSSAARFNIFGVISVNYEVNYTPLVSYTPLPLPVLQDLMDVS